MWSAFSSEYLPDPDAPWGRFALAGHRHQAHGEQVDEMVVELVDNGVPVTVEGRGNGPIAAFVDALTSRRTSTSASWTTPSTPCRPAATPGRPPTSSAPSATASSGASGIDPNIVSASLRAVVSAVNRAQR